MEVEPMEEDPKRPKKIHGKEVHTERYTGKEAHCSLQVPASLKQRHSCDSKCLNFEASIL